MNILKESAQKFRNIFYSSMAILYNFANIETS